MKIGRNDPCHCGSGKKYKRCCLGKDTEERLAARQVEDDFLDDADIVNPSWSDHTEVLEQFHERRPEIERAVKKLEGQRANFLRFIDDEEQLMARTASLFADERFAQFEFSRDEIRHALIEIGEFDQKMDIEKAGEITQSIMEVVLADGKGEILALQLLLLVPEYVAAERHIDGFIILQNALMIQQFPNAPLAPFAAMLCSRALESLDSYREQARGALFANLGMTEEEIKRMGDDQAHEWFKKTMSNPESTAALERFVDAYPEILSNESDEFIEAHVDALAFLNSEDGRVLYLDLPELVPWILEIGRRIEETPGLVSEVKKLSKSPPKTLMENEAIGELLMSVCFDMAAQIFTSKRLEDIRHRLDTFRKSLDAATARRLASGMDQSLMALHAFIPPAHNEFLLELCRLSLYAAMKDPDLRGKVESLP